MAQRNPITEMCFEEIFSGTSGYAVNSNAIAYHKESRGEDFTGKTLYGETPLSTIKAIFFHPAIAEDIKHAHTFYDLGSGIGNVAIGVGMLGFFKEINGVELFKLSHDNATFFHGVLSDVFPETASRISFWNESFLEHDFSHADVIFANHPIKSENKELLNALEEKFQQLKKGTIIIYVIRGLENTHNFSYLFSQKFPFSWGEATVHCYKKLV